MTMTNPKPLDCVVLGYNDMDIQKLAVRFKPAKSRSGAYEDVKTNSVLFQGRRITYMDLLNRAFAEATGHDPELNVFRLPNLGVCYLTSFLRRRQLQADFVNSFVHDRRRLEALLAESPRTVAITTTFYVESDPVREVVEFVREKAPGTVIIVGGPHIYNICEDHEPIAQEYLFSESIGADIYVHDAQGESTLARTVRALGNGEDLRNIPNLILTKDGKTFQRTERQIETNSLDLGAVDWSLFDSAFLRPAVSLRTARSCAFACAFCNYPTMAGPLTLAETDAIERELRCLREAGVEYINFVDDTFNVPLPRFKKLLRMMIANKFGFRWVSFFRCSNADDEVFELMREAGCLAVFLGIESGHPEILRNMNKKATPEGYRWGMKRLKENGIATWASVIVGYPGESAETVRTTMEFIESTSPTFCNAQLYYHDKRSPIHQRADEFGMRGAGYSWAHRSMDWQEAAAWVRMMFSDIQSSIPATLYGFSVWAFIYLLGQGVSLEQIRRFTQMSRRFLVDGFAEEEVDSGGQAFRELVLMLRGGDKLAPGGDAAVSCDSSPPELVIH